MLLSRSLCGDIKCWISSTSGSWTSYNWKTSTLLHCLLFTVAVSHIPCCSWWCHCPPIVKTEFMLTLKDGHCSQFGRGRVVQSPSVHLCSCHIRNWPSRLFSSCFYNDAIFLSLLCDTWLLYNFSSHLLSQLISASSHDRKCTKAHWTMRWGLPYL